MKNRSESVVMDSARFGKTLQWSFLILVVSVSALVILLSALAERLFSQGDVAEQSDRIISQACLCQKLAIDMETGLRGFQVTGDPVFLAPYYAAATNADIQLEKLGRLVSGRPAQTKQLGIVRSHFEPWRRLANEMRLRRETKGDFQGDEANLKEKSLMDATRADFAEFVGNEVRQRQAQNETNGRLEKIFVFAGLGLGLPLALALGWFLRRKLAQLAKGHDLALAEAHRERQGFEESENRKSAILAAALDAIITMDHEGKVADFNPAAERIFGFTRNNVIGRPMAELIIPERLRLRHTQGLAKYLATGDGPMLDKRIELPALRSDGREFPVEISVIRIRGVEPPLFTATLRDISDRQRAEEELRQQREWFRVTLCSIGDAVITSNIDGRVTFLNPAAESLTGWKLSEAAGQPMPSVVHLIDEETRQPSENPVARVLREDKIVGLANHAALISKTGVITPIEDSAAPIRGQEGNITGVVMVFRDATEIRQTQKAQREGAERLRFMAESMPQKIFTARPNGDVDYLNQQWMAFTGLTFTRIRDWGWTQFIHPDDVEENVRRWKHSLQTGENFQFEHRFRRHDGIYRWHLSRAIPMRAPDGTVLMWIGSNTDIDDQKRAEENLERTVKLRTEKLQETAAQLEEFSYSVAHDLRAPLRAMQGYAEAVLKDYGDKIGEEGKHYLQRIAHAGWRMDRLTLDVLNYTKASRAPLECHPVDLDKMIHDIICNYPEMQPPRAKITVATPLRPVLAHDPSLAQAVSNLLSNAVKFVAPGTIPEVRVWTEQRGGQVRLWVKDNGIGIKPEHQGRLFGIFERLNTNRQYEGTGIGLAIVRKVIEKMGGTSGVTSDGVSGSQFWIQLPRPEEVLKSDGSSL